jgi:hypothetical protein
MGTSIRWRHLTAAATAAITSTLVGAPCSAENNGRPIRLEYDAAEGCPHRDTFVAGLRARTNHFELTLAAPQATTYRVTLRSGEESTGRVESREPSGAPIVQQLHGATCREVVDALALVVALAIDARVADASAPMPAPAPPPPLAPSAASAPLEVRSDRPVGPTSRASRWAISTTVGIGVTGPFVGPEAFLEAALVPASGDRRISLLLDARLGASLTWSRVVTSFGDAAQFTRASALLDLCPLRFASGRFVSSACARGAAGALTASGGSLQRTRPALAGGALVVAHWSLWGPVFVQLEGGVVVPFLQDRFFLDGFAVYTVSPVDPLGSVAVGARFR